MTTNVKALDTSSASGFQPYRYSKYFAEKLDIASFVAVAKNSFQWRGFDHSFVIKTSKPPAMPLASRSTSLSVSLPWIRIQSDYFFTSETPEKQMKVPKTESLNTKDNSKTQYNETNYSIWELRYKRLQSFRIRQNNKRGWTCCFVRSDLQKQRASIHQQDRKSVV